MTHSLASFENAWRIACTAAELNDQDYVVVKTGRKTRPYIVEPANGQPGIIATFCTVVPARLKSELPTAIQESPPRRPCGEAGS